MVQVTLETATAVESEVQPGAEVRPGTRLLRRDRRSTYWRQISFAIDAVMFAAAVVFTGVVSRGPVPTMPAPWIAVLALLVLATFCAKGLYRPPLQIRIIDTTRAVVTATGFAMAVAISLRVIVADSPAIAEQSVRLWLLATAFLSVGRVALDLSELRARRAGEAGYRTLIVGAGTVGQLLAKRLAENQEFGLTPIGFLDKEPLPSGAARVSFACPRSQLESRPDRRRAERRARRLHVLNSADRGLPASAEALPGIGLADITRPPVRTRGRRLRRASSRLGGLPPHRQPAPGSPGLAVRHQVCARPAGRAC